MREGAEQVRNDASPQAELRRKYRIRGSPAAGLAGATIGFFVGFAAVALMGSAGPKFQTAMGLSAGLLGLLVAAPQLSGSLLRIPFAAWVDKVGGKKPLLTLLGISIVGMVGLTVILFARWPDLSGLFPWVLLFAVLTGAGVATFSVGIAQTSYWFPQSKQGIALGSYAGLGNTAPGWWVLTVPAIILAVGFPMAYGIWLIFLLAGTAVYAWVAIDAYYFQTKTEDLSPDKRVKVSRALGQELFPKGDTVQSLRDSARKARTWGLVALYFTSFGGFLALTTWLPTYWVKFHGFDLTTAAIYTAIGFTLFASFVRVLGGRLSDRFGGENMALGSFGFVLIGALAMLGSGTVVADAVGEALLGLGMGIANAAVFKLVPKYVPGAVGGASGWVGGLGAFGGFAVPPILGWFVDTWGQTGYSLGFVAYVGLAIMAIGVTWILKAKPPAPAVPEVTAWHQPS